jgi:hypothetical protein
MMNDTLRSALVTIIKSNRQKMSRAQRQRGVKSQRWLYPYATEARYAATIRAWLRPMKDYVHKYLEENQEAILHGDTADFRADSLSVPRLDAVPGKSFKRMIDSLNGWLGQYVPDGDESKSGSTIYMGLGNIADNTFDFNEGQFEKGAKSVLGVEFPVGEDWWPDARDTWAAQNYDLIHSDMRKYVAQINDLTERAVTSGLSVKELAKQIAALDEKITKGRANFIARDQIGKLNGEITQRRMEAVGLTMYVWETSGDERVRGDPKGKYPDANPSHWLMDGLLCRWDDSSVYSEDDGKTWIDRPSSAVLLHPGQDYLCRCTAIAYWQELAGEADALIAQYEELDVLSAADMLKSESLPPEPDTEKKAIPKQATGAVETIEEAINSKLSELQEWGRKTKCEQVCIMTLDGKVLATAKGNASDVTLTVKIMKNLTKSPSNSIISLHNHPKSSSFSIQDLDIMCRRTSIKEQWVVGANGKTYFMSVGEKGERPSLEDMRKYEREIEGRLRQESANMIVRRALPKGETISMAYLSARNKAFAERYGWKYREGRLDG